MGLKGAGIYTAGAAVRGGKYLYGIGSAGYIWMNDIAIPLFNYNAYLANRWIWNHYNIASSRVYMIAKDFYYAGKNYAFSHPAECVDYFEGFFIDMPPTNARQGLSYTVRQGFDIGNNLVKESYDSMFNKNVCE